MRFLLAGGGGFVGSWLARRLISAGYEVVIVDNFITGRRSNVAALQTGPRGSLVKLVVADVCRLPDLAGPFHAVLHLASPASPIDYLRHPLETLEAGSTGTRKLLEFSRRKKARFLLASTSEVYGDPEIHPQHESYWGHVNPVGPRSAYDEAKRYAEALASAYARYTDVCVRIARIFNTYGPGMRLDDGRVIPTFVGQALLGSPLTVFGDGQQTRSYCYVGDLVEALEALLWSDAEGPVNLGNPEEYTVLETARQTIALTQSKSTIEFKPLPEDDPRKRRPDITRARQILGWSPRTPFRKGLGFTVQDLHGRIEAGERELPDGDGATGPLRGNNLQARSSRMNQMGRRDALEGPLA